MKKKKHAKKHTKKHAKKRAKKAHAKRSHSKRHHVAKGSLLRQAAHHEAKARAAGRTEMAHERAASKLLKRAARMG